MIHFPEPRQGAPRPHVIYQIHIDLPKGRMTYTGRSSQGLTGPARKLRRDLGMLLNGIHSSSHGGYRTLLLAMAAASLEGWPVSLVQVDEADDLATAQELEHRHQAAVPPEACLNGKRDRTCVQAFREIVANQLRRIGLNEEAVQETLGADHLDPIPPTPFGQHVEPIHYISPCHDLAKPGHSAPATTVPSRAADGPILPQPETQDP